MSRTLLSVLLAVWHCPQSSLANLGCLDSGGNSVAWFTVYKMPEAYSPHRKKHVFPPHLYMDANEPSWSWSTQGHTLDYLDQSVGRTLNQVYAARGSSGIGYFMYNDEKPLAAGGAVTIKHAHAKGVLAVSGSGAGFWLIHSVPKYPPPANTTYSYPPTGMEYGQHFLCVTLGPADVDHIGYQFRLNDVWLYDVNWPVQLYPLSSNLTQLSKGAVLPSAHTVVSSVQRLTTPPPALAFISFSKSAKFGQDLYDSLVAPGLRASLLTETWSHGPAGINLNSTCDVEYQVQNIETIASESLGINFTTFQDHSKLALSDTQYVCIGDINRQVPQLKRGGGTVCFHSPEVAAQYNGLVARTDQCTTHRKAGQVRKSEL